MINHGYGIVLANDALCRSLYRFRCIPRLVNVLGGEIFEDGQIPPKKQSDNSKTDSINYFYFITECNPRLDQLFAQSVPGSSSGRIAGKTKNTTATSTCPHLRSSQHPKGAPQTPKPIKFSH